jgi:hypothetical protein
VLLSLLPVLLVVIEQLAASGGSVKVAGVALTFNGESILKAADTVNSTSLTANLETSTGAPVNRSSLHDIVRALRQAHDSEVTVVDLRAGHTWWEKRLFILIAGAARTHRPLAIAFVGNRNGKQGVFLGWAEPTRLFELHLAARPDYADAYELASRQAALWKLGTPQSPPINGQPPAVNLPWAAQLHLPPVDGELSDLAFVDELFLQQELDNNNNIQATEQPDTVTIQRLMELYEPALVTDHIEADANTDTWIAQLRSSQHRFFAMTSATVFKALVPRDAVLTALVVQLAESASSR